MQLRPRLKLECSWGSIAARIALAAVAAIFQNGRQQTYNRHQKVNYKVSC